ncbi:MAG: hypothetical protein IPO70_08755 [Bacteroidetes bacterium]|nr:hypothetical protein [Bacteroidota bacterium]
MGKFKVRLMNEGIDTSQMSQIYQYGIPTLQGASNYLMEKYSIRKINELEFEGDDINVDFEITPQTDFLDWDKINYPNDIIRGKVFEIFYFTEKYFVIKRIINKLNGSVHTKYSLERIADEAIREINTVKDGKFLFLTHYGSMAEGNIRYTVGREVARITGKKAKRNQRSDEDRAASQLKEDISDFAHRLMNYDVNKNPPEPKWKTNIIIEHEKGVWGADIIKTLTPVRRGDEIEYQLVKEHDTVMKAFDSILPEVNKLTYENKDIFFNNISVEKIEDVLSLVRDLHNYHTPKEERI